MSVSFISEFLLITGYFMCKKEYNWQKTINLLRLMIFYRWIIYAIFILTKYNKFSTLELIKTVLFVLIDFGHGFSSSFFRTLSFGSVPEQSGSEF